MHDKALCPRVEAALILIGKKWNGLLIHVLSDRAKRFSEIRALIPELSDKVLADKLKELEAESRRDPYQQAKFDTFALRWRS